MQHTPNDILFSGSDFDRVGKALQCKHLILTYERIKDQKFQEGKAGKKTAKSLITTRTQALRNTAGNTITFNQVSTKFSLNMI